MSKEKYIEIQQEIESYGFTVVAKDFERPWGAFLVIKEEEAQDFANRFFDGIAKIVAHPVLQLKSLD